MKYIINAFVLSSLFFFNTTLFGQGISNYNLYTINTYSINPAYVGSRDGVFTLLHFKNQMTGISNAPRNLMFVVHSPVGQNLGIGGNIVVGQAGLYKTTAANVASSYKVRFDETQALTFGLSGGFVTQSLDMDKLEGADLSDPTLSEGYNSKVFYKFGFGAVYNYKNLELSVAMPNLKQEERNLLSRYFVGFANYKYYTKDEKWKIQPSVLYKAIPVSPDQVDLYLTAEYNKLIWAMAGYRISNNPIVGAGITLENFNLGYSYEIPTGIRNHLSNGTHEVVFSYLIKSKSKNTPPSPGFVETNYADSTFAHIKELEEEIHQLKKEVGDLSHYVAQDSVRHTNDTIYTYDANGKHVKLSPGNYVVVQTCRTKDFAKKLVKMYKSKHISTFIAYNETQTLFYIIEKQFADFNSAKKEMEQMKRKGYKSTWVMVY